MARCPRCSKHFRTLEDEEGMHECPSCGYAPWNEPTCLWCSGEMPWLDHGEYAACEPYCSVDCAAAAERDSEEDN